MADTLTQEVQDAIQRNLPAQVAGVLQQHLADAATNTARLNEAEAEIRTLKAHVTARDETIRKHTATIAERDAQIAEYAKREAAFKESELAVLKANHAATVAEAARYAAMDVIGQVFRNATVKRSVIENGMAPAGIQQNGGYGTPMSAATNNSRTETEAVEG